MKFEDLNVILHGGDYNPEQWLDRTDILDQNHDFSKYKLIAALNLFRNQTVIHRVKN